MTGRLAGKQALVTAAGQGIGKACALAYAAEGANVVATDINEVTLGELDSLGITNLTTQIMDVRDDTAVAKSVGSLDLDVLLNCAGFVHNGSILDSTNDEWDFAFDLNVRSAYRTIRAALPGMRTRGSGSIVTISSVVSSIIGAPDRFIYGTTKAALIGLTKSVAKDYVTEGIRCNAICPGTVDSPSLHDRLRATGDYETAMKAFVARQPMGRVGTTNEIAALALYLASDDSAFTTGQTFAIDGGWAS